MGLVALVKEPYYTDEQWALLITFMDRTGYGKDEILAYNFQTRIFLTRNGGEYRVLDDGSIEHRGGPSPELGERPDG